MCDQRTLFSVPTGVEARCPRRRHHIHPPHLSDRTMELADGFLERLAEPPAIVVSIQLLREFGTAGALQQPELDSMAAPVQRAIDCRRLLGTKTSGP